MFRLPRTGCSIDQRGLAGSPVDAVDGGRHDVVKGLYHAIEGHSSSRSVVRLRELVRDRVCEDRGRIGGPEIRPINTVCLQTAAPNNLYWKH
jgi:hypothetical protein